MLVRKGLVRLLRALPADQHEQLAAAARDWPPAQTARGPHRRARGRGVDRTSIRALVGAENRERDPRELSDADE